MAKTTYQTYTTDTPIDTFRAEFIRRSAMCGALAKHHPGLAPIATDADAILGQIDTRRAALQHTEDDQVRARAVEDAEKLDVVDVYTELRRTLAAKQADVQTLLPDAPSVLGRFGAKTFGQRVDQAVANLNVLPDGDPVKAAFLPKLQQELAEFHAADVAEDVTRSALASGGLALTLYKAELSQAREVELGSIQKVLGNREKTALFTLPWRKTSKAEAKPAAPPQDGAPPASPPADPKVPPK